MNSFSVITGFNQYETMGMKSLEQGHNTAPPGDEIYGKKLVDRAKNGATKEHTRQPITIDH